jgi:PAS domain S-box-containing protein
MERYREELKKLEQVFRKVPMGLAVLDREFRYLYVNDMLAEMNNQPVEETIGRTIHEVVPDYAPIAESICRRVLDEGEEVSNAEIEGNSQQEPGGLRHWRFSCHPLADAGAPPWGVIIAIQEISKLKRVEEALKQSDEMFYRAFHSSPDGMTITSMKDNQLVEVNEGFLQLSGYTRDEIIGKTSLELNLWYDPEDRTRLFSSLERNGRVQQMEIRYRAKNGREGFCSLSSEFIETLGEQVVFTVIREITEQKNAEDALRQSEKKYRHLFEWASDGIIIAKGDRFIDCNDKARQLFGRSYGDLVGQTVWGVSPPTQPNGRNSQEMGLELILAAAENLKPFEWVHSRGDGSTFHAEISLRYIDQNDPPTILCHVRDITERKRSEEALTQAFNEIKQLKDSLQAENIYLREEIAQQLPYKEIIGESEPVKTVLRQIGMVAPTDSTVLILGESGTGKELLAHAIHKASARKNRPLIRVNCASIPKELYESEFFGHVKGAFTGAVRDRVGRFELANKGTIFLDEVGEIPLELQSKLLRVLQEGQYERVGGEKTRTTDVRIITATNRDLRAEMESGRFREDLYYRLNVFPIEIAPLRHRKKDIPALARHFIVTSCKRLHFPVPRLTQAGFQQLLDYNWPGNVRELQNVIERAIITSRGGVIYFELPRQTGEEGSAGDATAQAATNTQEDSPPRVLTNIDIKKLERQNILAALEQTRWQIFGPGGAAQLLGIKPTTLASRVKKLGLKKPTGG